MTLDDLLADVIAREGSDLHLIEGLVPKIRVHGELEPVCDELPDLASLVLPILGERHAALFEKRGEVDLAYELGDAARFRVNVFQHHGGLGAVLRLIPSEIPILDDLNVPEEVKRFADLDRGLVLVTGPTGSGKSSTLAALLGLINHSQGRHVVTVEDPIEFVHTDDLCTFTQREVGTDTESFADALRSAARQDPDLVLVGEMRDRETISLAMTLAEMGLLVFSTLHTNNAAKTIDRIVEVFSEEEQPLARTMLSNSLKGVLSQILCRRADGRGRVPATELLFHSTALEAVIREGDTHKVDALFQVGRRQGMHRLDDTLYRLATDEIISGEEAYLKAGDKQRFSRFLPDKPAPVPEPLAPPPGDDTGSRTTPPMG